MVHLLVQVYGVPTYALQRKVPFSNLEIVLGHLHE